MGFKDVRTYVIEELKKKCEIDHEEIEYIEEGKFDFLEDNLEFTFSLKGEQRMYVFWHNYQDNVGKLKRLNHPHQPSEYEVIKEWGDWNIYVD